MNERNFSKLYGTILIKNSKIINKKCFYDLYQ